MHAEEHNNPSSRRADSKTPRPPSSLSTHHTPTAGEGKDSRPEPSPAFKDTPPTPSPSSKRLSTHPSTTRPPPKAPKSPFFRRGMEPSYFESESDSDFSNDTHYYGYDDEAEQEILREHYTAEFLSELARSEGAGLTDNGNENETKTQTEIRFERKAFENTDTYHYYHDPPRTPPHQTNLPISTPGAPKADHRRYVYGRGVRGKSPSKRLDGRVIVAEEVDGSYPASWPRWMPSTRGFE